MKRLLAAILFILSWVAIASATQITVSSYVVQQWNYGGSTASLRIFSDTSFTTNDGRQVNAGTPNVSGGFYLSVPISISGTNATISLFTIDSTTDGQNDTSARYSAYFYSSDGRRLGPFAQFNQFFISPASGTSQTWPSISLYNYNSSGPPALRFTFDDAAIQRMIAAINAFTNPLTTAGDIVIATTGGALMRLPVGATNQYLGVTAGSPAWQNLTAGQITTALAFTPANKAGDTFTGPIVLPGSPTLALQAATKAYVDSKAGALASINLDITAAQTLTKAASFSELTITDDNAGDHKFGLSGPIGFTHGGTGLSAITSGSLVYASSANTLSQLVIAGSNNKVLHSNGTVPSWQLVTLTTDVTGILPGANGGTGNGFFAISGPSASLKTFTVPNASATILTSNADVTGAQGGTGFGTHTPYVIGDTLYADSTTSLAKLAAGANHTVLKSNGTIPGWGAVDINLDTTGTLPWARGGTGVTGFTAGYIKSDGAILSSQAVPIPITDGGTAATGSGYTSNGVAYYTGSAITTTALGGANTVLIGNGGAPAYSASPTLTGLTLSGIAAGSNNSLVFANTSGVLSADNSKLIWDSSNSRLSVKSVLRLLGSTSGNVDLTVPATGGNLVITLPAAEGALNQFLKVTASASGSMTIGYGNPLTGAVTSINGQSVAAELLTVTHTGASLTVVQSGADTNEIRIPDADTGVTAGLMTNATQSFAGAKTFTNTLNVANGTSSIAPIIFTCSGCATLTAPTTGAMEFANNTLYFTPQAARKTIAFTDTTISDGQLSANVELKTNKDIIGGYPNLVNAGGNAVVPLNHGGTGISLTIGANHTILGSDGSNVAFTTDGSALTSLNAANVTVGVLVDTVLSNNIQRIATFKNAIGGYAGLIDNGGGLPVLNAAQAKEIIASGDLTDFSGAKSGSGTTAIGATISGLADGNILKYDIGTTSWVNASPGAATGHSILNSGGAHIDAVDTANGIPTTGALIYANGTPKWDRLPIGANNTVLRSNGTTPSWSSVSVASDVTGTLAIANGGTGSVTAITAFNTLSPLNTDGDILQRNNAGNNVRIGIGTAGNVLVATATPNAKVTWGQVALNDANAVTNTLGVGNGGTGFGIVSKGDIFIGAAVNSLQKVVYGADNDVLTTDTTTFTGTTNVGYRHPVNNYRSVTYSDEFNIGDFSAAGQTVAAATTQNIFSLYQWSTALQTASLKSVSDNSPHVCYGRLALTANATAMGALCLSNTARPNTALGRLDNISGWDLTWVFRISDVSGAHALFHIGLTADTAAVTQNNPQGVYLGFDLATDTDFRYITKGASVTVHNVDSGVALDTNWHRLRIRAPIVGKYYFSLDGSAETTIDTTGDVTQAPVITVGPFIMMDNVSTNATARNIDMDYFGFNLTVSR